MSLLIWSCITPDQDSFLSCQFFTACWDACPNDREVSLNANVQSKRFVVPPWTEDEMHLNQQSFLGEEETKCFRSLVKMWGGNPKLTLQEASHPLETHLEYMRDIIQLGVVSEYAGFSEAFRLAVVSYLHRYSVLLLKFPFLHQLEACKLCVYCIGAKVCFLESLVGQCNQWEDGEKCIVHNLLSSISLRDCDSSLKHCAAYILLGVPSPLLYHIISLFYMHYFGLCLINDCRSAPPSILLWWSVTMIFCLTYRWFVD